MFIRFLFLLLSYSFSVSCFAKAEEFSTDNEPEDKHLGIHLSLTNRDYVPEIFINDNTFLLIDPDNTNIKVVKDSTTGLNHLNALVAYTLYLDDIKKSALRMLYVQCPITRTTYADHSEVLSEDLIDGKMVPTSFKVDLVNLKEESISSGYYKFLKQPEERNSAFSNNFALQGKVSQQKDIELLCMQANISYARYKLAETNRPHFLKKYGISE